MKTEFSGLNIGEISIDKASDQIQFSYLVYALDFTNRNH